MKRLTEQNPLDELDEFSKQAIWKARWVYVHLQKRMRLALGKLYLIPNFLNIGVELLTSTYILLKIHLFVHTHTICIY